MASPARRACSSPRIAGRRHVRLRPDYPEELCNLANALAQTGRFSEAIARYQQALRLEPGRCFVAGRRADRGLYDHDLATYDASDSFRHEDSAGFVRLWGLSVETWARAQGGPTP